jgi:hypothetical protein
MRKEIYERFKKIERYNLKKILDYLDKECNGLDNFDLIQAGNDLDLNGLVEYIKVEYGIIIPSTLLMTKEAEKENAESLDTQRQRIEEQELINKSLETIRNAYFDIDDLTDSPQLKMAKELISLSSKSKVPIIIYGKQGTGKSTLVRVMLDKFKLNYAVLSTATTYIDLIRFLWNNKSKDILMFEDVVGLWENDKINSLMRQVFGNSNESVKVVNKGTPDYRVRDIDDTFEIKGNVIVICNEIKNKENAIVQALLDRCAKPLYINISTKEFLMMYRIILSKSQSLTELEKDEIMKFVEANCNDAVEVSLRTIYKVIEFYKNDKNNWKKITMHELSVNPVKKLILEIKSQNYRTIGDEVQAFKEKATTLGLPNSRASFFRYQEEMKPMVMV